MLLTNLKAPPLATGWFSVHSKPLAISLPLIVVTLFFCLFVRSFVCSFIRWFHHLFLFVRSSVCSFVCSFIRCAVFPSMAPRKLPANGLSIGIEQNAGRKGEDEKAKIAVANAD